MPLRHPAGGGGLDAGGRYPARTLLITAFLAGCTPSAAETPIVPAVEWGIAIHGGAGEIRPGTLSEAREDAYRAALEASLRAGHAILQAGGTSGDAVVAAIRLMEDSPLFNAGRGGVRTAAGTVELDASIMLGPTRSAGAVAVVTTVRNPIELAKLVMDRSPHVLMVGAGAEAFGDEHGAEMVPENYFLTAAPRADEPEPPGSGWAGTDLRTGTVGAVALDRSGNLAAGTSTGGTAGKLPGRVGDSPIIGAGTYADDRCGAISATGHGEYFMRALVAYDICAIVLYRGASLAEAAEQVILETLTEFGGRGGIIAMAPDGTVVTPFNSAGMFRGWMMSDGDPRVAIYRE